MKIVATISDCSAAANVGGGVESRSAIIDLGDKLPRIMQAYLDNRRRAKKYGNFTYQDLSFSILDEDKTENP